MAQPNNTEGSVTILATGAFFELPRRLADLLAAALERCFAGETKIETEEFTVEVCSIGLEVHLYHAAAKLIFGTADAVEMVRWIRLPPESPVDPLVDVSRKLAFNLAKKKRNGIELTPEELEVKAAAVIIRNEADRIFFKSPWKPAAESALAAARARITDAIGSGFVIQDEHIDCRPTKEGTRLARSQTSRAHSIDRSAHDKISAAIHEAGHATVAGLLLGSARPHIFRTNTADPANELLWRAQTEACNPTDSAEHAATIRAAGFVADRLIADPNVQPFDVIAYWERQTIGLSPAYYKRISPEAVERALDLLRANRELFETIVIILMEYEVITEEEMGKTIERLAAR